MNTKQNSFEDILDFAIEKEEEAYQMYSKWAEKVSNSGVKEQLKLFAAMEAGHKAKLQKLKQGSLEQSVAHLSTNDVVDLKISDYMIDVEAKPDMTYQDALIIAMKQEKAAYRLYTDIAKSISNQAIKDLFLALAQEEARHKLAFEVEYDDYLFPEG